MTKEDKARLIQTLSDIETCQSWESEAIKEAIEVLSQQPCKDAISREDALDILEDYDHDRDRHKENAFADARARLVALPSVTPIRPKGKWIEIVDEESAYSKTWHYECSECGKNNTCFSSNPNFCPNCGADMRGEKDKGVEE